MKVYRYPLDAAPENKTPDKATITYEPYEVSDEQLYQEQIERGSNDGIHEIKTAFDNWDSLSPAQKREIVKELLTCMLNLYRGQY